MDGQYRTCDFPAGRHLASVLRRITSIQIFRNCFLNQSGHWSQSSPERHTLKLIISRAIAAAHPCSYRAAFSSSRTTLLSFISRYATFVPSVPLFSRCAAQKGHLLLPSGERFVIEITDLHFGWMSYNLWITPCKHATVIPCAVNDSTDPCLFPGHQVVPY